MKQPYEWPSREQWAEQHQHPYPDWIEGGRCPYADKYSHRLSDYATSEEVAALTTALKNLYRDLGRKLQAANLCIKTSDQQQRGEGHAAWYRRFRELPPEDQESLIEAGHLRSQRSEINDLLARIRNNEIPNRTRCSNYVPEKPGELVAPINARYNAARKTAADAYDREYAAQHPADDAAWEKELRRRAAIDRQYEERHRS
jgi:hypothetical protein